MLDEARGVYFTWLAQDDLLLSPDYITTTVEYLERHPDVVCCASALIIYDNEVPGPGPTMAFPEIHPDRPWHQARLELFRWPQRPVHLAIYGMYRRAALQQVPFVRRIYRGRPNADCWEMPVLTGLMRYGRIVALPSPLRGYRDSLTSDGHRIIREASPFDFLVLGFWMKLLLIQRAWQLPGPCHRRLPVLRLLLRSLFRANLRRPMDYRTLAGTYAAELAMLRETARERAQVIEVLQHAIRESHQQRRARDQDPGPPRWNVDASPRDRTIPGQPPPSTDRPHADAAPPHSPPDVHASPHPAPDVHAPMRWQTGDHTLPSTGPEHRPLNPIAALLDFFRPPSRSLVAQAEAMNRQIGRVRAVCAERLATIEALDAELRSLRASLDTSSPPEVALLPGTPSPPHASSPPEAPALLKPSPPAQAPETQRPAPNV